MPRQVVSKASQMEKRMKFRRPRLKKGTKQRLYYNILKTNKFMKI